MLNIFRFISVIGIKSKAKDKECKKEKKHLEKDDLASAAVQNPEEVMKTSSIKEDFIGTSPEKEFPLLQKPSRLLEDSPNLIFNTPPCLLSRFNSTVIENRKPTSKKIGFVGLEASEAVVFGNSGILQGVETCETGSKGYVEMTGTMRFNSQKITTAITSSGGRYLESHISGSLYLVEEDSLSIFAVGDRELFESCQSCFDAVSKRTHYEGTDVGSVSEMSLAYMFWNSIHTALGEAMTLAENLNISRHSFLEVLKQHPMFRHFLTK
ncbi:oxidoreductase GLYR1 [Trichonephila inaurata madagascariensis]|uniref:Oxidoreductase GLYR1 n=1 Tax=Trichonephila inaurata madagascariensis TaxID=2747483 RepID=A0A8X6XFB5_9ARAC|nr:oxidoreductase GLYR1 [Trichonephila inaurata madagascariensis]